MLALCALFARPAAADAARTERGATCSGAGAEALRCVVASVRRSHGLRALRISPRLARSASLRAAAIRRCHRLSHTPCGQSFISVFQRAGYARGSYSVGENLAWGVNSPQGAIAAWLGSPGHRANLLSARWRDVGIARITMSGTTVWVCQFGRHA